MGAKQVLVMKKFPKERNMRTGKYIAQGAHASLGSLLSIGSVIGDSFVIPISDPFVKEWLVGNFRKITCYVDNDEELIELHRAAIELKVPCSLIVDSGLTEFNGVPTLTAVGIGPADEELINKITGKLKLF